MLLAAQQPSGCRGRRPIQNNSQGSPDLDTLQPGPFLSFSLSLFSFFLSFSLFFLSFSLSLFLFFLSLSLFFFFFFLSGGIGHHQAVALAGAQPPQPPSTGAHQHSKLCCSNMSSMRSHDNAATAGAAGHVCQSCFASIGGSLVHYNCHTPKECIRLTVSAAHCQA